MMTKPRPGANEVVDPSVTGPDPGTPGDAVYFVWQKIGQIQHSLGALGEKIDGMKDVLTELRAETKETKKSVARIEKITFAAGVVLAILVWFGGKVVDRAIGLVSDHVSFQEQKAAELPHPILAPPTTTATPPAAPDNKH